ncbi:unnamed protein product, partial [Mesorhabditis spiculigera]
MPRHLQHQQASSGNSPFSEGARPTETDRSPVDYVNWDVDCPSRTTNYQNAIVPENCTLMNNNGKWNDVGCSFSCYSDAACLCMKRC